MVKLIFNPKQTSNCEVLESKVSKKKSLNPFHDTFNEVTLPEVKVDTLSPQSTKDLIGLDNCAYVLNDWYIRNTEPTKNTEPAKNKSLLLIVGPVGCGKTSLIELYCKENSIQLYSVKTSEKPKKDILREMISFVQYSTTNFFTKSKNETKKLIFIDEYQNSIGDNLSITDINTLMLFHNKKENKKELSVLLNGICDINSNFTLPPIVIVSADSKGSKLSDLKKIHEVYYINEIPPMAIKVWVKSLNNSIPDNILMEIIQKCKSDKRILLNLLNLTDKSSTFIETFYKDCDLNIFDCIKLLFDGLEPISLDDIFKIYDTDGFLLPQLVHENYLDYNQDIFAVANSAESISRAETIFSDTYESSKTFLPDAHCLHALCIPSYHSKDPKINKNIRTSCINNRYNVYLNNRKNINKINESASCILDFEEIFYIKKFLNHDLIKQKQLNQGQEAFLKNIIGSLKSTEKMELIYKHFSDFNGKELKTKNFTIKFKEKISLLINGLK